MTRTVGVINYQTGELDQKPVFDRAFLEHAVKTGSQYDATCRRMAAQILAAEARIAELEAGAGTHSEPTGGGDYTENCDVCGAETEEGHTHQQCFEQGKLIGDIDAHLRATVELNQALGASEVREWGQALAHVKRLKARAAKICVPKVSP